MKTASTDLESGKKKHEKIQNQPKSLETITQIPKKHHKSSPTTWGLLPDSGKLKEKRKDPPARRKDVWPVFVGNISFDTTEEEVRETTGFALWSWEQSGVWGGGKAPVVLSTVVGFLKSVCVGVPFFS